MGFIKRANPSWTPEWQSPGRSIPVCFASSMVGHVVYNSFNENRDSQNTVSDGALHIVPPICGAKITITRLTVQIASMRPFR